MSQKEQLINDFLSYQDSIHFTLKRLSKIVKSKKKKKLLTDESTQHLVIQVLVRSAQSYKTKKRLFKISVDSQKTERFISTIWPNVFSLPLHESTRDLILVNMDDKIYPYVKSSGVLATFLIEALNLGKHWGLMSLVNLMLKSNFECPKFYEKLYASLFNISTTRFGDENKMKLFLVLERVMKSTHLPTYVVASFAKLLARKAIFSPLPETLVMLNLVGIIISFHETTRFLLRSKSTDPEEDPFDETNPDFTTNNVMNSFLWEFHVFKSHHNPFVRQTVQSFTEDSENAWKWRLTFLKLPSSLDVVGYLNLARKLLESDSNWTYDAKAQSEPVSFKSEFVSFDSI
ncbi:Nucleolar complex protein 4 [Thelohanellus kitauei]|uniref:Nucleolar complex protein 4 n=1 Tax=Thelohanellus kitauei TaxID=669202 RepID=A0A0C2MBM2_THEKT|nr:Nucleolar complex protein 4 [Thelohanellus kitauei]